MESNLRTERNQAFVLKETDIDKVWNTMQSDVGEVYAEVSFSDSIERKVKTLGEVLAFENSNKKKITRIGLYARSSSGETISRVVFEDSKYRPIQVSASGIDDVVTKFGDNMSEILDGLKPWYSIISKLDFFYVIGFVCWIAYMLLKIMTPDTPNSNALELVQSIKIIVIVLSVFGIIALSIWGLNRLRGIYFPFASFAIGQGLERYRVQENVRWGVVIAFVVSLAASTVFAVLT